MFLETNRLTLRKWEEADFDDFYEYANNPEMCRMMGRADCSDPESARQTFHWLKDKEERGYAMVLKENGKVIGNLTVTSAAHLGDLPQLRGKKGCAMSFSVSRHYQRRGYMEAALGAVIHQLFTAEGMDYINCGAFDFNLPSLALQRKLGFLPLKTDCFVENGETITVLEQILWRIPNFV